MHQEQQAPKNYRPLYLATKKKIKANYKLAVDIAIKPADMCKLPRIDSMDSMDSLNNEINVESIDRRIAATTNCLVCCCFPCLCISTITVGLFMCIGNSLYALFALPLASRKDREIRTIQDKHSGDNHINENQVNVTGKNLARENTDKFEEAKIKGKSRSFFFGPTRAKKTKACNETSKSAEQKIDKRIDFK